jgi:ketosteroid isomerase-like protein
MVAVLAIAAVVGGCATSAKGPTPEEQIRQAVNGWIAAAQAKDVNKMMAFVAPDFSSSEWQDKEAYKAFIADSVDMGYLDDMVADTKNMKITFGGKDKAVVGPIDVTASFGSAALNGVFKNEGGKWLLADLTMEM